MALIVSMLVGQLRVIIGVDDGLLVSYREMTEDETANAGSVRWRVILVKAFCPSHVAVGALFEVVS